MSFANWDQSYSVQVQRLDAEHQQLFAIINQLYEAMKAGRGSQALQDVLQKLLRYTEQHFSGEEALLRQANYPELDAHVAKHREFTGRIRDFSKQYASGAVALSVEILDFLKNWLSQHIMATDHKYSSTLNRCGIR